MTMTHSRCSLVSSAVTKRQAMAADSSGSENNQAGKLNAGASKKRPVHAFVAPKIIGGKNALSPVGELGMVEMTQALELIDVCYEQV
uniref:Uncharacterized protein n=2 Tax=Solanum lycopersicum TaxID=4081 RepID=A0A3Q7EJX0_SOLLC|nr:riboflavin biosynthesis protein PYRR, chloroplastic-like [Solanum lycopersicum]